MLLAQSGYLLGAILKYLDLNLRLTELKQHKVKLDLLKPHNLHVILLSVL